MLPLVRDNKRCNCDMVSLTKYQDKIYCGQIIRQRLTKENFSSNFGSQLKAVLSELHLKHQRQHRAGGFGVFCCSTNLR